MPTPTTDRAYARGETAPTDLLGVLVYMVREYGSDPGPHRIQPTYWVGLTPDGAPNVDAAMTRAETDHPGYIAQDWRAD